MAESQQQQGIPTRLSCEQFQQFVSTPERFCSGRPE